MPHEPDLPPHVKAQRTRILMAAVALAIALLVMMFFGKTPTFSQGRLNTGYMAAFVYKPEPADLPAIKFVDAKGEAKSLADWKGRTVLLNLWATWCAPCRKEMPDLDRLQAEFGGDKFEVVALGVDRGGVKAAEKFLEQVGTKKLALYVDGTARMAGDLRVIGLPATLLIDADGREVGRLLGPAEWASDEAKALIRSVMR